MADTTSRIQAHTASIATKLRTFSRRHSVFEGGQTFSATMPSSLVQRLQKALGRNGIRREGIATTSLTRPLEISRARECARLLGEMYDGVARRGREMEGPYTVSSVIEGLGSPYTYHSTSLLHYLVLRHCGWLHPPDLDWFLGETPAGRRAQIPPYAFRSGFQSMNDPTNWICQEPNFDHRDLAHALIGSVPGTSDYEAIETLGREQVHLRIDLRCYLPSFHQQPCLLIDRHIDPPARSIVAPIFPLLRGPWRTVVVAQYTGDQPDSSFQRPS